MMKLSRLYSNKPSILAAIDFAAGFNVVRAEIRLPENKAKDTHNLGKTTLGRLIDFCLLSKRDDKFFLFRHLSRFEDFAFLLELELFDGSYVTVRRDVREHSKINIKRHPARGQDFTDLPDEGWDHYQVAFERSRVILDGILDLTSLKPWNYRKGLGYLVRTQEDYLDVFQLGKFQAAHIDWKPYVAHVLGFDGELVKTLYEKENDLEKLEQTAETVRKELGGTVEDLSKVEGILQIKQKEAITKAELLEAFDFRSEDKKETKEIVDKLDSRIAQLNQERYTLNQNKKRVQSALGDDQILFNPSAARELFDEAGVLFPEQLTKDFSQLISFNQAITDERRGYLAEELQELNKAITTVGAELNDLGKKRSNALSFLSEQDVFVKYRAVSDELVTLRADILSLERQRVFLRRLQDLRSEIRTVEEEKTHLQSGIEENVEKQNSDKNSFFNIVRLFFNEIVVTVLGRQALISVSPNNLGHLEFDAEILDDGGHATSADAGHTYKKLLCIAFDMAVLRAHALDAYPRFTFHDGAFESLDDRKKINLLNVMREYSGYGLQQIITVIDSDLPMISGDGGEIFTAEEVILELHDEGEDGRLFKMPAW
jgi:uncharacterized protein YydD (DUF2326 family)